MTEYDIIEAMHTYGGGFVRALAQCWRAADRDNRKKLLAAFPDLFKQYEETARLALERKG